MSLVVDGVKIKVVGEMAVLEWGDGEQVVKIKVIGSKAVISLSDSDSNVDPEEFTARWLRIASCIREAEIRTGNASSFS